MKKLVMALLLVSAGGGVAQAQDVTTMETANVQTSIAVAFTPYVNGKQSDRFQSYFGQQVTAVETADGFEVSFSMKHTASIATFTIDGVAPVKIGDIWTFKLRTLQKITMGEIVVKGATTRHTYQFDLQFHVPGKQEYVPTPFRDIAAYENEYVIGYLFRQGIFTGATHFNPNKDMTRSQFAQTLTRAFAFSPTTQALPFQDIAKLTPAAKQSIQTLWAHGILTGKTATAFGPSDSLTRRQAAVMIYRVLQQQGVTVAAANPFKDVSSAYPELVRAVGALHALGIMTGSDGLFKPDQKLTRHQMAKVLHKTLQAVN